MKSLINLIVKFLCYAVLLFGVAQIIATDAKLQSFKESSNTEHAQDIILFISFCLALYIGYKFNKVKTLCYTLSALLLISFVREMDAFFDATLFHGAWVYFAGGVLLIYGLFIHKIIGNMNTEIKLVKDHISLGMVTIGLLIIHVFSRLYGRKKMWKALMGEDNFIRIVKDASEEGIELLGYSIIFIGIVELYLYARKSLL